MMVKTLSGVIFILLLAASSLCAAESDVAIVLSSGGKAYKDGDTITVRAGTPLMVTAKVFVKECKAPGGVWKKNSRGAWRFYKEIKGYSLGIGVGEMTVRTEKEDFSWDLMSEPPVSVSHEKTLCWMAPSGGTHGTRYTITLTTLTTVRVKTEGSASSHGVHLDYNLPGGGKRQLPGKAVFHVVLVH
jgi:hypothetical protein